MVVAVIWVGMTSACERDHLRMRDETQAQFTADRPKLEGLADKVLYCKGLTSIRLKDWKRPPCLGGAVTRSEIVRDLRRLNLKAVHWAKDGSFVLLVNGESSSMVPGGTPWSHSGMIRHAEPPGPEWSGALTPPPHHWFYTQND